MGKTRLPFVGMVLALATGLIPLCARSVASAGKQHRIPTVSTAADPTRCHSRPPRVSAEKRP